MAYPFEHYLLTMGGTLGASEEWSIGFRTSAAFSTQTQEEEAAMLPVLAPKLAAHFANADNVAMPSPVSSAAALGWVKYNRVDTQGRYVRQTTNVFDLPTPGRSPHAVRYPNQIALALTLHTGVNRGLAARGRVFLPSPKYPIGTTDNTLTSESTAAAAAWGKGLLDIINLQAGIGVVCVYSKGRMLTPGVKGQTLPTYGPGTRNIVERVSVGSVLDTMRSRRTSLTEVRTFEDVIAEGFGGDF